MQEGFVRLAGYQLTQWTAQYPSGVTADALAELFLIAKSSLGESLVRVATLADLVAYPTNQLKCFEARGSGGNMVYSALAGDVIRLAPSIDYWLQVEAPYADCDFVVESVETTSGTSPTFRVGNYLQLNDYVFTDDDVGRWFQLGGFTTSAYNAAVKVVSIVSTHTAIVAFTNSSMGTTNEDGTSWSRRRLVIQTNTGGSQEPRYFPTTLRGASWNLLRGGSRYASGADGETSREDPNILVFRDRRVTSLLPSLDAALALIATTKAAVGFLQAAADTNNTAFLGTRQTDYP